MKTIIVLAVALAGASVCADEASVVTVDPSVVVSEASPDLWGLFFEDIDLSLDGGVYAEFVRNRSFEDGNGSGNELTLAYWNPVGNAECFLSKKPDAHPNDRHCVTVRGRSGAGIANEGYFGMGIRKGMTYNLSFALKGVGVKAVDVALEAYSKPPLATTRIEGVSGAGEWQTFTATLVANDTDPQARLVFRFVPNRQGGREGLEAQLDHVSLFPADAVAGLFRRDLVEKLAALRPSFLRFPGGCWVEGDTMKEAYRWKTTIGDKWNRRTQWNIWKYWSTNGVGFHEYLLLSEALGAKPLFCINVGMSHKETVPMDKMGEFVQDALDCIEYANGPVDSEWGAKRAAAGHPEPFGLKYLEIGNENGGKDYEERYALMAKAVREKYPDVQLVFDNWKETKRVDDPKDLRDDHFYDHPDRLMGGLAHEYDEPKGDFGIFVGEYAVVRGTHRYGSLRGAIGEAAFMMGLERNQNQVKLAAYAPLFANAQHTVWTPNLIYPTTLGSFVNPSWTVQKLFSENRGADVLKVEVKTGTFETKTNFAWGKGVNTNVIENVQASAVRDRDGSVILKVANCTEEPQAICVEGVKGQAVKTLFGGGDAMAHNSPAEPEALKESVSEIDFDGTDTLPPLSLVIYRFQSTARCCAMANRVSLDKDWTFMLEGQAARKVDVPHDWSIEFAPSAGASTECGGGFYLAGKATYERKLKLTAEEAALPDLALDFEGVYRDSKVFVNGVEAGRGSFYGYTGFRIPLAGRVHAGDNTLRVEVDNSAQPNCRWYSGSGIVRPVWLVKGVSRKDAEAQSGNGNLRAAAPLHAIKWSVSEGLSIDGTNVLLHGACVHHDHGPLGAASYDGAELRKVRQLKAAGFNAVRCSHNPASEAFLDACDAEGLWVVQELCDGWREKKNPCDYGGVFEADWEKDLRWMVERDRHHPSIIAWSIGNEILERTSPWAVEQAGRMAKVVKEIDPSRPVLEALCAWRKGEWTAQDAMAAKLDIVGYNYMEAETERDHERCPRRVIVYTETYPKDAVETWRRIVKHPYVIGEFVWTGIDYLGEASIGRTYYEGQEPDGEHYQVNNRAFPWHGAYCGDIDLTGWRKPISHLRETLWNECAPTYVCCREPDGWRGKIRTTQWSVWPQHEHWNFGGWEGKPVTVEIYTRKPHVELWLNSRKIGEADVSAATAWTAKFEVPYEPGELKALGCDSRRDAEAQSGSTHLSGSAPPREITCDTAILRTAGEPKKVRWTSERFGELEYLTAEIVDENGVLCPEADWEIEFPADVIATCSADLRDTTVATSRRRKASQGRALGIRRRRHPAAAIAGGR